MSNFCAKSLFFDTIDCACPLDVIFCACPLDVRPRGKSRFVNNRILTSVWLDKTNGKVYSDVSSTDKTNGKVYQFVFGYLDNICHVHLTIFVCTHTSIRP